MSEWRQGKKVRELGGCFWPVTITGLGIKWVSNKLDTATKVCEELETKKEKEAREQAELLQRVDRMIAEKDKTYAPTSQEDWELEARKTEYETGL